MLASSKLDVDSVNRKKIWLYILQELGTFIFSFNDSFICTMNDTVPGYVGAYVVGFLLRPWYQWETLQMTKLYLSHFAQALLLHITHYETHIFK